MPLYFFLLHFSARGSLFLPGLFRVGLGVVDDTRGIGKLLSFVRSSEEFLTVATIQCCLINRDILNTLFL
jgi:hypothetical protein